MEEKPTPHTAQPLFPPLPVDCSTDVWVKVPVPHLLLSHREDCTYYPDRTVKPSTKKFMQFVKVATLDMESPSISYFAAYKNPNQVNLKNSLKILWTTKQKYRGRSTLPETSHNILAWDNCNNIQIYP